jgi:hypothetical protein
MAALSGTTRLTSPNSSGSNTTIRVRSIEIRTRMSDAFEQMLESRSTQHVTNSIGNSIGNVRTSLSKGFVAGWWTNGLGCWPVSFH